MEGKNLSILKVMGVVAATALIVFGSFQNILRTAKLAWDRVVKG